MVYQAGLGINIGLAVSRSGGLPYTPPNTLIAGSGSYLVTGTDVTLAIAPPAALSLTVDAGSYAVTGTAATLTIATAPSSITWNSADKHADLTLSGGDLIATRSATASPAFRSVRATGSGRSSGKYYFEVTINARSAAGTFVIGIADSGATLTTYSSANAHVWADDGATFADGGGTGSIQSAAVGNVMGFAYDLTNLKWWARTIVSGTPGNWNNDILANQDPENNVGGKAVDSGRTWFPYISLYTNGDNGTANFGGSAFSASAPTGFVAP